jgi:hypothetical protein
MTWIESADDEDGFALAMERARAYLEAPSRPARSWPVVVAAAAFAASSLVFVTVAILSPPVTLTHLPPSPAQTGAADPRLAGSLN